MAGEDERPLGRADQLHRAFEVERGNRLALAQAGIVHDLRPQERGGLLLGVFADVHENRARPAVAGDGEGLAQRRSDVLRAHDQAIVLGDGQRDAGDVRLLERVAADEVRGDLTGDEHGGDGVEHRVRDSRGQVGGSGTGGREGHADLAGGAGVTISHVSGALLVANQDVMDRILGHGVVDGQEAAARVAEYEIHALAHQALPDDPGPGECLSDVVALAHVASPFPKRSPEKAKPPRFPSGVSMILGWFCLDHRPPGSNKKDLKEKNRNTKGHHGRDGARDRACGSRGDRAVHGQAADVNHRFVGPSRGFSRALLD
jgi:hypothetical protein